MTLPAKMARNACTIYLNTSCLIKHMNYISIFLFLQTMFIFIRGFSAKVTCTLNIRSNGGMHRNKHFSCQENDDIFHIFSKVPRSMGHRRFTSNCRFKLSGSFTRIYIYVLCVLIVPSLLEDNLPPSRPSSYFLSLWTAYPVINQESPKLLSI